MKLRNYQVKIWKPLKLFTIPFAALMSAHVRKVWPTEKHTLRAHSFFSEQWIFISQQVSSNGRLPQLHQEHDKHGDQRSVSIMVLVRLSHDFIQFVLFLRDTKLILHADEPDKMLKTIMLVSLFNCYVYRS